MPDIGLGLPTGATRAPKGPPGKCGSGFKRDGGRSISQFAANVLGGVNERTEDVESGKGRKKTCLASTEGSTHCWLCAPQPCAAAGHQQAVVTPQLVHID